MGLRKTVFGRKKGVGFLSSWKTDNLSAGSTTSTQVKLPLVSSGTYNFVVNWGDSSQSTITAWNQVDVTHTYSSAGTYNITITGVCTGWQFNNTGDRLKILSITKWGDFKLGNTGSYFYGCANLNLSGVSDILNLTGTTSLSGCFRGCTALTTVGRMNEWNTAAVTTISDMFLVATAFNQNIGSWNVSNVTNMSNMFQSATAFNQNIGSWNVSNVTNMNGVFESATAFNQNIGSWNVSNVTNMSKMFQSATAFNQNIGSLNVSNVTDFTNFMISKTYLNFSAANLDAIYNNTTGWASRAVQPSVSINFGTIKYSQASKSGKDFLEASPQLWTIVDGKLNVSATSNNGGLIRVTTSVVHGFTTGNSVFIYGVGGTTNANGTWTVTVISTTIIELQGSSYNSAFTSGGNVIAG